MAATADAFENLVKQAYTKNMLELVNFDPFSQKNPSYLNTIIHAFSVATFEAMSGTLLTTVDTGFGSAPPIPTAGTGKITINEIDLHSRIYSRVRSSVQLTLGVSSGHDAYPPTKGNSGEILLALLKAFTVNIQNSYQQSVPTIMHPMIYQGVSVINPKSGLGLFTVKEPNIMINQILASTPALKGAFWRKFVECYCIGFYENITQEALFAGNISGICVSSVAQVCNLPMVGAGTGTLLLV